MDRFWADSWKHIVGMFVLIIILNGFFVYYSHGLITTEYILLLTLFGIDFVISFLLGAVVEVSQKFLHWGTFSSKDIDGAVIGGMLAYVLTVILHFTGVIRLWI